jgi:hypothetical protein
LASPIKVPEEISLKVHFTDSEASQAAGCEFLKHFLRRIENRDPEVNEKVAPTQIEAIGKWGVQREGSYEYLKDILQPTLVINGDDHVIIYSINSWILQQNIPNAQLIIHPNANHGSRYQYPERFVRHVSVFLSESGSSARSVFESTLELSDTIMTNLSGKAALSTDALTGIRRAFPILWNPS